MTMAKKKILNVMAKKYLQNMIFNPWPFQLHHIGVKTTGWPSQQYVSTQQIDIATAIFSLFFNTQFIMIQFPFSSQDVLEFFSRLPNLPKSSIHEVPYQKWNHLDYLYGNYIILFLSFFTTPSPSQYLHKSSTPCKVPTKYDRTNIKNPTKKIFSETFQVQMQTLQCTQKLLEI